MELAVIAIFGIFYIPLNITISKNAGGFIYEGYKGGKPGKFIAGLRKHLRRDPYRPDSKRDYFRES
jgi:hypothetical protein